VRAVFRTSVEMFFPGDLSDSDNAISTAMNEKKDKKDPTAKICDNCSALGVSADAPKLSECARCGLVVYCSRACQRAHWKSNHKQYCVVIVSNPKIGRSRLFWVTFGYFGVIFGLIRISETPNEVKCSPAGAKTWSKLWGRRINEGFNSKRGNRPGLFGVK